MVTCNGYGTLFRYLGGDGALDLISSHDDEYDSIMVQKELAPQNQEGKLLAALPAYSKYWFDEKNGVYLPENSQCVLKINMPGKKNNIFKNYIHKVNGNWLTQHYPTWMGLP